MAIPRVAMGIGIATGEVIVGNVGSKKRSKHTAMGGAVNLGIAHRGVHARRRDPYLTSDVRQCSGSSWRSIACARCGPRASTRRCGRITTIRGRHELTLPQNHAQLVELAEKIGIRFTVLEGKSVSGIFLRDGQVSALSSTGARIHTDADVRELADLRIELADDDGAEVVYYGKVVDRDTDARFMIMPLAALDPADRRSESALTHHAERAAP